MKIGLRRGVHRVHRGVHRVPRTWSSKRPRECKTGHPSFSWDAVHSLPYHTDYFCVVKHDDCKLKKTTSVPSTTPGFWSSNQITDQLWGVWKPPSLAVAFLLILSSPCTSQRLFLKVSPQYPGALIVPFLPLALECQCLNTSTHHFWTHCCYFYWLEVEEQD